MKSITKLVSLANRFNIVLFIAILMLCMPHIIVAQNPGQNCFNTKFRNSEIGYNANNAYLLAYLTTMMYPEYLRYLIDLNNPPMVVSNTINNLRDNDRFAEEYEKRNWHLFTNKNHSNYREDVTFEFLFKCNVNGYNPEAMIISTSANIFVIFRGTDRVECADPSSFAWEWAEWLGTDFDATSISVPKMNGTIHKGFWQSLNHGSFLTTLNNKLINQFNVRNKKLWVAAHSLGGAHAQLFALNIFLDYGIKVQGMYLYGSPHPGGDPFAKQLDKSIGKSRIQRFEMTNDPIPYMGPLALLFGRAGTRNKIWDINSIILADREQIAFIDDAVIFSGIGNIMSTKAFKISGLGGTFCHHHPTFYLKACRNLVMVSEYSQMPQDIPLPQTKDNCTVMDIAIAKQNTIPGAAGGAVAQLADALQNITWKVSSLVSNLAGVAIPPGEYYIRNYQYYNASKNYLELPSNCITSSTSGCPVSLNSGPTSNNQKFIIEKLPTGFYTIKINNRYLEADPVNWNQDNAKVLAGNHESNPIASLRQQWIFYEIPNTPNLVYLIINAASGKALDAYNSCNSGGTCLVEQFAPIDNDKTQVWILESSNISNVSIPEGNYYLKSAAGNKNKCISLVKDYADQNSGPLTICHPIHLMEKQNMDHQKLSIKKDGGGGYKIRSNYKGINETIDMDLSSNGNNSRGVIMKVCDDNFLNWDHQLWYFHKQPDGSYIIYSKKDPNVALDAADEISNGSKIYTYGKNLTDITQKWILERIP